MSHSPTSFLVVFTSSRLFSLEEYTSTTVLPEGEGLPYS